MIFNLFQINWDDDDDDFFITTHFKPDGPLSQLHVGVLNGKYDLAGSEFKIWPSNYDLEVINLERKN